MWPQIQQVAPKRTAVVRADAAIARAYVLGLRPDASHALEYICGTGVTTAALGRFFGSALGIDVDAASIAAANSIHRDEPSVSFLTGDAGVIDDLGAAFHFVYADLGPRTIVGHNAEDLAAILARAVAPGGVLAIRLQRATWRDRAARCLPRRAPSVSASDWRRVMAVLRSRRMVTCVGKHDGHAVWLYGAAPRHRPSLVRGTRE